MPDISDFENISENDFFRELRPGQIAMSLFQFLPEIIFWIKDREGRFQFVNQAYCEHLSLAADKIIGLTDHEVHTRELAQVYAEDDQSIIEGKGPILNKSELVSGMAGGIEWRSTSKIPLYDKSGDIVGSAGFSRRIKPHENQNLSVIYGGISRLVDYVYENIRGNLSIPELAQKANMSISTLERHFKTHLSTTPKRFLVRAKIAASCKVLLNSDMTIAQAAEHFGYQEHASFTRAFTSVMNMSPHAYRNFYKGSNVAAATMAHPEEIPLATVSPASKTKARQKKS